MTVDAPPSVRDLAASLVETSARLFRAPIVVSPLAFVLGSLLLSGAAHLFHVAEYIPERAFGAVVTTIALAPLHLNILSPLIAKRLLGARARRLLPAGSILVVRGDGETWRLFAHATVVTAAALAVLFLGVPGAIAGGFERWALTLVLMNALWFYRLVVITALWLRHEPSLGQSVAVLSRIAPGYREPGRFFLEVVEGRREVLVERVDGARVEVKYLDTAPLAAEAGVPAGASKIEGAKEVWRAAAPAGAEVVAAWLEEVGA